MKIVIDQVLGVITQVDPNITKKCDAGVGPKTVQSKQGPETSPMEDGSHDAENMVVDRNINSAFGVVYPDTVQALHISQMKECSSGADDMAVDLNPDRGGKTGTGRDV